MDHAPHAVAEIVFGLTIGMDLEVSSVLIAEQVTASNWSSLSMISVPGNRFGL
jgi:hypothetical protein